MSFTEYIIVPVGDGFYWGAIAPAGEGWIASPSGLNEDHLAYITIGSPWPRTLPKPDGTLDALDRQHLLRLARDPAIPTAGGFLAAWASQSNQFFGTGIITC